MKKSIINILAVALLFCSSCKEDNNFTPSIFDTTDKILDPTSASYEFDNWLRTNYLKPYNLDFRYKLQDVGSDLDYNLVPTSYVKSQEMAKLVKYLWFDVYGKLAGEDFLKQYGPRIIHLIGSPAYNPSSGTITLGTAEGGLKITLYRCNFLDPTNVDVMNEFYFKTMHHEFAHILHQKKTYPVEFNTLSASRYKPLDWQNVDDRVAASLGFVSPYAGSQNREDFVEVIANYLVKNDKDWNQLLVNASKGWKRNYSFDEKEYPKNYDETTDMDGIDGKALILQKLSIAKAWLMDEWNLDIDAMRKEILERQLHINEILK